MKLKYVPLWVLGFLAYVYALFYLVPFPLDEAQVFEQRPRLASVGQSVKEFDSLITRIRNDLKESYGKNVEIEVVVGPYFLYRGIFGQLYSDFQPRYFILIDIDFYNWLTPEEREALVAHEAGHIIFNNPGDYSIKSLIETQKLVDTFATKYVKREHMLSFLDKLFYEYHARKENLQNLPQGQ